jgi:hypothetical protein
VQLYDTLRFWTDQVLFYGMLAIQVWAFVDCATRKAAAFPAANRLTKASWLAITGFSGAITALIGTPLNPLALIAVIAASVYLADVRPAVRDISPRSW